MCSLTGAATAAAHCTLRLTDTCNLLLLQLTLLLVLLLLLPVLAAALLCSACRCTSTGGHMLPCGVHCLAPCGMHKRVCEGSSNPPASVRSTMPGDAAPRRRSPIEAVVAAYSVLFDQCVMFPTEYVTVCVCGRPRIFGLFACRLYAPGKQLFSANGAWMMFLPCRTAYTPIT
jgi:hypothetical protein